nr:LPS assembly lipoprotein LptE [uncultured Pseudogulbenkiania sp.]
MTRFIRWLACAVLAFSLAACGFQLRGTAGSTVHQMPFGSVYLSGGDGSLKPYLRTALRRQPHVTVTVSAKDAEAALTITEEKVSKDILTINSAGKVNEYQLIYRVTARLSQRGVAWGPDMTVIVRRSLGYSDSAILGKEQEETQLWNDMRRDAAEQLVTRLGYLKEAPGEHAGTQP